MAYNKKSQITIFLILGLLIIIGGAIFFYLTREEQKIVEPEIRIVQEQVPVELDPLRSFINNCVYDTALEGLTAIGRQGGYISLSDRSLNYEAFTITQKPTESDAVLFAPESDLRIPYWWYLKSANNCKGNCQFASKKPDLRSTGNSIEKQLERYMASKIKDCTGDFEPFRKQGYTITEAGQLKADVTIALNDIAVVVEYPLAVEIGERKTELKQFSVTIPVNLEKIYDLAARVANLEIKHRFLEKHAMNLIAAFSGVNKDKLPPMSDMQFKFGSNVAWLKSDVQNKITSMLTSYMPLFQVEGTQNFERALFGSELKQRLYDTTIIPIDESFRDLAVQFSYLDFWPMYFDLNCDGERCVPSSANSLISFFGIQDYRFAYDLSFPVLVEVNDPLALNGRGYSFNLFLEGNVRNNKPLTAEFSPLEITAESEGSLLCDSRTSGDVKVKVTDAAAKNPIEDAQILYSIIDESCFIGSTDENGILVEKFPVAVGGVVNALKENYIGKAVEFDPKLDLESSLKIDLQPVYTKNIAVKKKNVVKTPQGWRFVNTPVELSDKEQATISLTRISEEGELDFSAVASYEGQQQEQSLIEIAPGTYEADITLVSNERITIPEEERCPINLLGIVKECYKTPKIDFGEGATQGQERFPAGGLKAKLTINADELLSNNKIVLYAVNIDLASVPEQERVIEDIEQISKIEDYSSTYQVALQPTFE